MAINCGRRHQQRRRRGSGNAVVGRVSSQSQTLSDSQGNVVGRVSSQSDSQGNVVDGVSSQSQTLSDSPLVKPVSHLSRRQQRDELERRRKLSEIEQRRNLMKNTPSSSDSTFQSPFFYDIDEGSSDSDAGMISFCIDEGSSDSDAGPYMVKGVPVPCDVCGGPHSVICCPYFSWFPRDGHLVNQRDYVVVCECGQIIVDDRCPSGSCFPCRLRRVEFKNLNLSPPYDPAINHTISSVDINKSSTLCLAPKLLPKWKMKPVKEIEQMHQYLSGRTFRTPSIPHRLSCGL